MRLQEISRKMLAKRRRICVDTQTDSLSTIRMRDVAITVEEPKIYSRDVSVLTEVHEDYEKIEPFDKIVMRVKEMSTTTRDFPKLPLINLKDAANITEDHGDEHDIFYYLNYELPLKNHDDFRLPVRQLAEGSSNTDHAPSNLESKERVTQIDQFSDYYPPVFEHQPLSSEFPQRQEIPRVVHPRYKPSKLNLNEEKKILWPNYYNEMYYDNFRRRHRHPDDSIISINLPDKMNITIESPNSLESKVQVFGKNQGIKKFHANEAKTQDEKANELEIFNFFDRKFDELDDDESREFTEDKLERLSARCRRRIPSASGKYVFSSKTFQCESGGESTGNEADTKAITDRLANLEIIERTDDDCLMDNLNFVPGISGENNNFALESCEKNDGVDSNQSPYDVCLKTIEKLECFLSKIHNKDHQVCDKNDFESEREIERKVENVEKFCEEKDEVVNPENQDLENFNYHLDKEDSQSSSRKYFSPFVRNNSMKFVPKKKYQHPFSPRNIFLRFLHERRKIVQDSFGTGNI